MGEGPSKSFKERSLKGKAALTNGDDKKSLHALMIGMTGSGKTSFFNFVCSFLSLKKAVDSKELPVMNGFASSKAEQHGTKAKTESQTDEAIAYCIPNLLPGGRTLKLIDSPGFGDTRGMATDDDHCDKIVTGIVSQKWLNAIILVISGRDARIPATLKYVLRRITAVLPKKILSQVVVVYTNCSHAGVRSFDHEALTQFFGARVPDEHTLHIDNPFAMYQKLKEPEIANDAKRVKRVKRDILSSFEDALEDVEEIVNTVSTFERVSSAYFQELHAARKGIERQGIMMKQTMAQIDKQQQALKDLQEQIAAGGNQVKLIEEKLAKGDWVYLLKPDPDGKHNMICQVSSCTHNCHLGCSMPPGDTMPDYRKCEVFCDHRQRKLRFTHADGQKMLDNLVEQSLTTASGGSEGTSKSGGLSTFVVTKNSEVYPLSSGEKIYGCAENSIGQDKGMWMYNKNFKTTSYYSGKLDEFRKKVASGVPFDHTFQDNAHMEKGPQMTCQKCNHPLESHAYNTLKRVHEFQYDVTGQERTNLETQLASIKKTNAGDVTSQRSQKSSIDTAAQEKQKAITAMVKEMEKFQKLAAAKSYKEFLRDQNEVLKLQMEEVKTADLPQASRLQKISAIKDHMQVISVSLANCEQAESAFKSGGYKVEMLGDTVDESEMQRSMDAGPAPVVGEMITIESL